MNVDPSGCTKNPQSKQRPYPLTKEYLLKEYEDVFTGIGCFHGLEYHIELDQDATPVQHPPRQVPVHLQLARLVELEILKEVKDEYTPWISSAVVTPKSNCSIRVCLDPRNLNKAIRCNRHYVRSVDDIIPKVAGATHFSILDARSGFWQVKIDEESSMQAVHFQHALGEVQMDSSPIWTYLQRILSSRVWTV